jgi:hypothetical protein
MYVIPEKDLRVLDPYLGDSLPPEGREVADNSYWYRQLRDKSVVLGAPPERPSAGAKKSQKKESQTNGQATSATDAEKPKNE